MCLFQFNNLAVVDCMKVPNTLWCPFSSDEQKSPELFHSNFRQSGGCNSVFVREAWEPILLWIPPAAALKYRMKRSCQRTWAGSCPSPSALCWVQTQKLSTYCKLQDPGLSATILYDYSCKKSTEKARRLFTRVTLLPRLNTCPKLHIYFYR